MLDLAEALAASFDEVSALDFYREIFPAGSFEERGIYEAGRYNGIAVCIPKGGDRTKRITVTDELDAIADMVLTDDFCLMSPISYAGKSRDSRNARFMYALAIDLDGVERLDQWQFFMRQVEFGHEMLAFIWGLPRPTYLVSSGTGIHIYYVFEKPVPMYRNIVEQLEVLKKRLTWQAWTQGASSLQERVQYESLFQGFRVVGTITKKGDRCRAFKVGEKVTVEYLNRYVPEEYRVKSFSYQSNISLQEAMKKYPAWYQKRIVEGSPKQTWTCKKDLYDWWIRRVIGGAEPGHRYWCIMTLATYAKKCGVPKEQLEKDAYGLIPLLNSKGDKFTDRFTEDDVLHALEAYTDSYITYPINTIVNRTGIQIKKNKRNGRKQATHLKIARFTLETMNEESGKALQGRPKGSGTAEQAVKEWQEKHPDGKKADCIRDTRLSKPSVYKWWRSSPERTESSRSSRDPDQLKAEPKIDMYANETQEQRKERHYREWQEKMEIRRKRLSEIATETPESFENPVKSNDGILVRDKEENPVKSKIDTYENETPEQRKKRHYSEWMEKRERRERERKKQIADEQGGKYGEDN